MELNSFPVLNRNERIKKESLHFITQRSTTVPVTKEEEEK